MAEITTRRTGELVRGVFSLLLQAPDGMRARDVLQKMHQVVPPTPFESSDYPNSPGLRRYEKIIRFSTIASVKAGWLVKSKGQWVLTEEGTHAYHEFPDPDHFQQEAMRLYKQWEKSREPSEQEAAEQEERGVATATSHEEAEENAWAEIEAFLVGMNPYDLQELVAALLKAMGYHVVWIAPPGNKDYGVDILAHTDPLGASGPRVKVQVKRREQKTSAEDLRSFLSTLANQDVGVFVSTGGFTSDAESEARRQEQRRIMLLDLQRLFDLWVEHYERIDEESKEMLPLKPIWFLAPRA